MTKPQDFSFHLGEYKAIYSQWDLVGSKSNGKKVHKLLKDYNNLYIINSNKVPTFKTNSCDATLDLILSGDFWVLKRSLQVDLH